MSAKVKRKPKDLLERIDQYVKVRDELKELEAVREALNGYFLDLAGNAPAEFVGTTHKIVIDRGGRLDVDKNKVILAYGKSALSKLFTRKSWLYVTAKEIEDEGGPPPSKE